MLEKCGNDVRKENSCEKFEAQVCRITEMEDIEERIEAIQLETKGRKIRKKKTEKKDRERKQERRLKYNKKGKKML